MSLKSKGLELRGEPQHLQPASETIPQNIQLGGHGHKATDTRPRQVRNGPRRAPCADSPTLRPSRLSGNEASRLFRRRWPGLGGGGAGLQSDGRLGADGRALPAHGWRDPLCALLPHLERSPSTHPAGGFPWLPARDTARSPSSGGQRGHTRVLSHHCPQVWPPISRNRGLPETCPQSMAWLGCTLKD